MINLMPTEEKRQIRAARVNIFLIRYSIIVAIAFGFLLIVIATSYVVLLQNKASAQQLIESNDTKAAVYSATQAEITSLSANLSGAKTTLDQQLSYAKVLSRIGQSMPAGTVLKDLTLLPASFDGTTPITLQVFAKNNSVTASLQPQFQGTGLFTNVTLGSVSEQGGVADYPVSATMTLTLSKAVAQ